MENLLSQDFDEFAHDYYLKDGTFMRADDTYANAKSRLVDAEGEQVVAALEEMTWFADRWARIKRPTREPDGPRRRRCRVAQSLWNRHAISVLAESVCGPRP